MRYRGPHVEFFFFFNCTSRTGFTVSKRNVLIWFSIIVNEKSLKALKFELKLNANRVILLDCMLLSCHVCVCLVANSMVLAAMQIF